MTEPNSVDISLYGINSDYVRLPDDLSALSENRHSMHKQDYRFFEALLAKYGVVHESSAPDIPKKHFGKTELLSSLDDIAHYASGLRGSIDEGYDNGVPPTSNDPSEWNRQHEQFLSMERRKPSSGRLADMYILFLRMPQVKDAYDQFHAEKMAQGLGSFMQSMNHLQLGNHIDRSTYFLQASDEMERALNGTVSQYDPQTFENLADAVSYNELGMRETMDSRIRMLGSVGVGTFISFLQGSIEEGIGNGENLEEKLRREFLPRRKEEGVARRSMKTDRTTFLREIEPVMKESGHEAARELFRNHTFRGGRCPAILRGRTGDGSYTERPVVYEYASVILNHMPQRLRQK